MLLGGLRRLRLNPAQSDEILLATILPLATLIVCSFGRVIFACVLVDATDAAIDIFQTEILTRQTNFLHIVHKFVLSSQDVVQEQAFSPHRELSSR